MRSKRDQKIVDFKDIFWSTFLRNTAKENQPIKGRQSKGSAVVGIKK